MKERENERGEEKEFLDDIIIEKRESENKSTVVAKSFKSITKHCP